MITPSEKYIKMICTLYGSTYDDRIENTAPSTGGRPAGSNWEPGRQADHRSLASFQKELRDEHGMITIYRIKKHFQGNLLCRPCINRNYNVLLKKSDCFLTKEDMICPGCFDKKHLVFGFTPIGYAKTIGR